MAGNVVRVVDQNGTVVGSYEYNAFGEPLGAQDPPGGNRFQFQSNWIALKDSGGTLFLSPTRLYDASTGRFVQRDPTIEVQSLQRLGIHENSVMANQLAIPVALGPQTASQAEVNGYTAWFAVHGSTDPSGLLSRDQLDWLAWKYAAGWPGVAKATRDQVATAIKQTKEALRALSPNAFAGDQWKSPADDKALQELLGASPKDRPKDLAKFPGSVYRSACGDCKDLARFIQQALSLYPGSGITTELMVAWATMESNWNIDASAYGETAGKSSAAGLIQITDSTWEDYRKMPKLPQSLNFPLEVIRRNPYLALAAGIFVLDNKPGKTLWDNWRIIRAPGVNPMSRQCCEEQMRLRSSSTGGNWRSSTPKIARNCSERLIKLSTRNCIPGCVVVFTQLPVGKEARCPPRLGASAAVGEFQVAGAAMSVSDSIFCIAHGSRVKSSRNTRLLTRPSVRVSLQ